MKKFVGSLIVLLVISFIFGCAYQPQVQPESASERRRKRREVVWPVLKGIHDTAIARGFITVDELDTCIVKYPKESGYTLLYMVKLDLLPFKAMFYLALEKEDYNEAEMTRRTWLTYLETIKSLTSGVIKQKFVPYRKYVDYEIEKLTRVVGLTDPMLVTLRKDLALALYEKNWDDAQKIQNLVTARVSEIRPPTPKVVEKHYIHGGDKAATQQQPSTTHRTIERIPRYGAEDVGRALSLLDGKGGMLTGQQTGALRIMDMLMKR